MKWLWKKQGKKYNIKNINLSSLSLYARSNILKNEVLPNKKIMIAVSGGPDSILTACLVYNFFIKNKYNLQNLFFIHCNHRTREGNKHDEEFVKDFFEETQLIVTKRKNTKKSTEAELRNRRYGEFKKYAKKYNIDYIIFWHNLTDRIESTFLNLLRGANLNGFLAMQPKDNHHLLPWIQVLRPILELTKNEVIEICKKHHIPFVTDPTNNDISISLRNKLRNKVLPELYALANKQNSTTNSFIESIKNIYTQLEQSKWKDSILKPIDKSTHRNAKFAYQRIITPDEITNECMMQLMKKLHISNNITTPLLNELTKFLKNSKSGYKYFNGTYLFKSHGNIYLISAPKAFREKTVDSEKKIDTTTTKRFPRKGDKYKGKTRNQWCINQKIPIFRRNFIPVVAKKNQIIKVFT